MRWLKFPRMVLPNEIQPQAQGISSSFVQDLISFATTILGSSIQPDKLATIESTSLFLEW